MSGVISSILRFVLRVFLLLAGLIMVASVLVAAAFVIALWLLRRLWARITGQPVAPLVLRVSPRAQWGRFYGAQARWGTRASPGAAPGGMAGAPIDDVTDVQPKEPRSPLPPPQSP